MTWIGVKQKKAFLFQYCVPAADVAEPDERYVREAILHRLHTFKKMARSRVLMGTAAYDTHIYACYSSISNATTS